MGKLASLLSEFVGINGNPQFTLNPDREREINREVKKERRAFKKEQARKKIETLRKQIAEQNKPPSFLDKCLGRKKQQWPKMEQKPVPSVSASVRDTKV